MNIWSKMIAVLESESPYSEGQLESAALSVLDEEIRHVSTDLKQMAQQRIVLEKECKVIDEKRRGLVERIERYKEYALKAIAKKDDALALEVAEKIVELKLGVEEQRRTSNDLKIKIDRVIHNIKQSEYEVRRLKQQVDTVKATDNIQKAQVAVAVRASHVKGKVHTAMDSLSRMRELEQSLSMDEELVNASVADESDPGLQERLRKAGIIDSSDLAMDVLNELKKTPE